MKSVRQEKQDFINRWFVGARKSNEDLLEKETAQFYAFLWMELNFYRNRCAFN